MFHIFYGKYSYIMVVVVILPLRLFLRITRPVVVINENFSHFSSEICLIVMKIKLNAKSHAHKIGFIFTIQNSFLFFYVCL